MAVISCFFLNSLFVVAFSYTTYKCQCNCLGDRPYVDSEHMVDAEHSTILLNREVRSGHSTMDTSFEHRTTRAKALMSEPRVPSMLWKCCCQLVVLLVCMSLRTASAACTGDISSDEYDALETFYESTGGRQWQWSPSEPINTRWSFPNSLSAPCSVPWQGITCDVNSISLSAHCTVTSLILSGYNLTGRIPPEIGNVSSLTVLQININNLAGTPTSITEVLVM